MIFSKESKILISFLIDNNCLDKSCNMKKNTEMIFEKMYKDIDEDYLFHIHYENHILGSRSSIPSLPPYKLSHKQMNSNIQYYDWKTLSKDVELPIKIVKIYITETRTRHTNWEGRTVGRIVLVIVVIAQIITGNAFGKLLGRFTADSEASNNSLETVQSSFQTLSDGIRRACHPTFVDRHDESFAWTFAFQFLEAAFDVGPQLIVDLTFSRRVILIRQVFHTPVGRWLRQNAKPVVLAQCVPRIAVNAPRDG
jgi:hypothetical protein